MRHQAILLVLISCLLTACQPDRDADCDAPSLPLKTMPSGMCLAKEARIYWNGTRCENLPFNQCFFGDLRTPTPALFATMQECEARHAQCL